MADERRPLPQGYRQGIITAITVLLGFSLLFLRFWSFDAPGDWTPTSIVAALLLGISLVSQFIALWRALQVADDDEREYGKTLRWFLFSVLLLAISLVLAELYYTEILPF
ncbi:MAG TPA: hypothetical protein VN656_13195 [Stellaceae bacterium]|jgi:hypothetical protein|nr:hypothetical protein [Stellaceae bacterium]